MISIFSSLIFHPSSLLVMLMVIGAGLNAGTTKNPMKPISSHEKVEICFPVQTKKVNFILERSVFLHVEYCSMGSCRSDVSIRQISRDNSKPLFLGCRMLTENQNNKANSNGLRRWIIPCAVTLGTGALMYAAYSIRGR